MKDIVSIITPTYNRAALLRTAIESVLAQTYPHWELLVVDDDSTDDTVAMVASFNEPRIRYEKVPHGGASRAVGAVGDSLFLFHRHGFGDVARFVDVVALGLRHVVGEELEGNDVDDGAGLLRIRHVQVGVERIMALGRNAEDIGTARSHFVDCVEHIGFHVII